MLNLEQQAVFLSFLCLLPILLQESIIPDWRDTFVLAAEFLGFGKNSRISGSPVLKSSEAEILNETGGRLGFTL